MSILRRFPRLSGAALLATATVALWWRTLRAELLFWDDRTYFFEDQRLVPLDWTHLRQILTTPFFANYHPVTTLTIAFDRWAWGNSVAGFHATQLALYVAGVVLTLVLFERLLRSTAAALVAAALFASQALHAEAVAWLASRKDVVCLVWYVAAILVYAHHADQREREPRARVWRRFGALLACSLLAMLSKGYAVVLPGVFLAYDLCYERRFRAALVWEKLAIAVPAFAVTLATLHAQAHDAALLPRFNQEFHLSVAARIAILLKVFALYVGKSLLPIHLSALYVVSPEGWLPGWVAALGASLLCGALVAFAVLRRRQPAVAFGIALFLLPLAAVMNTFFTLRCWMADRYLTLPSLGVPLALVAAAAAWRPLARIAADLWPALRTIGVTAVLCGYVLLTTQRIDVWMTPTSVWSDVLRKTYPELAGRGELTGVELRERAAGLTPLDPDPFWSLAAAYERQGRAADARLVRDSLSLDRTSLDGAIADYKAGRYTSALERLGPIVDGDEWAAPDAAKLAGDVCHAMADDAQARSWYARAGELARRRGRSAAPALRGEGALEFAAANYPRALELFRAMRAEDPLDPHGPYYEGLALDRSGRSAEAYPLFQIAQQMQAGAPPGDALDEGELERQMGVTALRLAHTAEAIRHFQKCLELSPDAPQSAEVRRVISGLRSNPG